MRACCLTAVVVAVMVAGCSTLGPSPSSEAITDPPSSAAAAPSAPTTPSASPAASATTTSLVTVQLDPTHVIALTIVDQSALLLGARSATEAEQAPPDPMLPTKNIFAFNPTSESASDEVRLVWVGSICDLTAELQIGPDVASMTVTEGPRGSCDAMGVGRGVVLSFARHVDAASIALALASGP